MENAKVLVVEDDRGVNDVLCRMLAIFKHEPISTASCEEAVGVIESGAPIDVIILDWGLPGLSGNDALGKVRELCPDLTIVISSGLRSEVEQLAQHPVDAYLHKPFTTSALKELMEQLP